MRCRCWPAVTAGVCAAEAEAGPSDVWEVCRPSRWHLWCRWETCHAMLATVRRVLCLTAIVSGAGRQRNGARRPPAPRPAATPASFSTAHGTMLRTARSFTGTVQVPDLWVFYRGRVSRGTKSTLRLAYSRRWCFYWELLSSVCGLSPRRPVHFAPLSGLSGRQRHASLGPSPCVATGHAG